MSPDFESRGVRTDAAFQDVKNVRCVKLSAPFQTLQEPRGKLDLTCTPQNHTLCCPRSLQDGPPVILARGCQALQVEGDRTIPSSMVSVGERLTSGIFAMAQCLKDSSVDRILDASGKHYVLSGRPPLQLPILVLSTWNRQTEAAK